MASPAPICFLTLIERMSQLRKKENLVLPGADAEITPTAPDYILKDRDPDLKRPP